MNVASESALFPWTWLHARVLHEEGAAGLEGGVDLAEHARGFGLVVNLW
jgi:hypothetical protein